MLVFTFSTLVVYAQATWDPTQAPGQSSLENTYWKLIEINGKIVEATNSFKLSNNQLELYDDDKLLARLEARPLK